MSSHHPIVPYISLCSGYEGIGLGLHRVIRNLRCIAYCEREIFGAANLCAKAESGLLDPAPIFTDVHTFPWQQFAPFMAGGILSFGWPCQPVSHAGKRKATEDERWLFDTIADGIAVMRPGWLFAENVEGLLSARMPDGTSVFGHCITRLESLHYKVAAGIFSASEVGAPHQRKRVFILAHRVSAGSQRLLRSCNVEVQGEAESLRPIGACGFFGCGELADTERASLTGWRVAGDMAQAQGGDEGQGLQRQRMRDAADHCGATPWPSRPGEQQFAWEPPRVVVANAANHGHAASASGGGICGDEQDARRQEESQGVEQLAGGGSFAGLSSELANAERATNRSEARRDQADWQDTTRSASGFGRSSQGTMGNAASERPQERSSRSNHSSIQATECGGGSESDRQTQPSLGRDADGPANRLGHAVLHVSTDNRTDELRLLGNGVVPATAERAFRVLVSELMEEEA